MVCLLSTSNLRLLLSRGETCEEPHSTKILEVFTPEGFTSRYYVKSFKGGGQPLDLLNL